MVTGVETAGLVLASIPLAVSLAEHYRSGLKPFRDLRHFHREFKSHAVQVGTQHAIFRKNLDKLLRQIVPAAEAELLMKNPGGLAWTDAQLEQKFKTILGESYGPIIDNIAEINRVIDKLKKGLGPTSTISPTCNRHSTTAGKPAPPESLPWWVRVHFSFSRAKWSDLVQLLERHNDNIARLLEGNDERYPAAAPSADDRKHQLVAALQNVKTGVSKVHEAITQSWRCACPVRHHACLLLHDYSPAQAMRNVDAFSPTPPAERFDLLFRFGNVPVALQSRHWDLFDVKVELLAASKSQLSALSQSAAEHKSRSPPLHTSTYASATRRGRQAEKSQRSNTALGPQSQVTSQPRQTGQHPPKGEEIQCLCAAISAAGASRPWMGLVCEDSGHGDPRLFFADDSCFEIDAPMVLPLEGLLGSAPPPAMAHIPLSRHQRFRAALALASSYLYLHQTPWLPDCWSKRNILLRPDVTATTHQLYVDSCTTDTTSATASASGTISGIPSTYHASISSATMTLPQRQSAIRLSLRGLGIVLMELCFGHALEAHPYYKDLLQWKMPAEVLADVTARHWQRSVYGEAGPDYGQAVQACVSGDLEMRHVRPADLLLAVHAGVVQPLERVVRQFEGLDNAMSALSLEADSSYACTISSLGKAPPVGVSQTNADVQSIDNHFQAGTGASPARKRKLDSRPTIEAPHPVAAYDAAFIPHSLRREGLRSSPKDPANLTTWHQRRQIQQQQQQQQRLQQMPHLIQQDRLRKYNAVNSQLMLKRLSVPGAKQGGDSTLFGEARRQNSGGQASDVGGAKPTEGASTDDNAAYSTFGASRRAPSSTGGQSPAADPVTERNPMSYSARMEDLSAHDAAKRAANPGPQTSVVPTDAQLREKPSAAAGVVAAQPTSTANASLQLGITEYQRQLIAQYSARLAQQSMQKHAIQEQNMPPPSSAPAIPSPNGPAPQLCRTSRGGPPKTLSGAEATYLDTQLGFVGLKPPTTTAASDPPVAAGVDSEHRAVVRDADEGESDHLWAIPLVSTARDPSSPSFHAVEPAGADAQVENPRATFAAPQLPSTVLLPRPSLFGTPAAIALPSYHLPKRPSADSTSFSQHFEHLDPEYDLDDLRAYSPPPPTTRSSRSGDGHTGNAPSSSLSFADNLLAATPNSPGKTAESDPVAFPRESSRPLDSAGLRYPTPQLLGRYRATAFALSAAPTAAFPSSAHDGLESAPYQPRSIGRKRPTAVASVAPPASMCRMSSAHEPQPQNYDGGVLFGVGISSAPPATEKSSRMGAIPGAASPVWPGNQTTPTAVANPFLPQAGSSLVVTTVGVRQCIKSFDGVLAALKAAPPQSGHSEKAPDYLLRDELGRFRIWAASTGMFGGHNDVLASRSPNSSSAVIADQTQRILYELRNDLDEGKLILTRTYDGNVNEKRERVEQLLNNMALDPPDRQEVLTVATDEPATELRRLSATIAAHVSSLLKLSACVSRPAGGASSAPQARLDPSCLPYTTDDEAFVVRMFPLLQHPSNKALLARLATAIAARRQHFRPIFGFARMTRRGEGFYAPTASGNAAAEASSQSLFIESTAKPAASIATGVTVMSTGQPVFVLRRPEGSKYDVSIPCPFCSVAITTAGKSYWREHVMNHFRPYVCTSTGADGEVDNGKCSASSTLFASRRAWIDHELAAHRRQRQCRICSAPALSSSPVSPPSFSAASGAAVPAPAPAPAPLTFASAAELDRHLRTTHIPSSAPLELQQHILSALRDACETPVAQFRPADCAFCAGAAWRTAELKRARREWLAGVAEVMVSPARFAKHVGRHMEQLALAALLPDGADLIKESAAAGSGFEGASDVDSDGNI